MFDIPPPENDNDAISLGNKIRKWIKDGRPEPGLTKNDQDDTTDEEEIQKHDKEEPKKKKGRFGFFKK
ncbi:MAG: hypothetical protein ACW9W4_06115 [Candidatus Nitrosopumilus sp. bin_7KS]